MISKIVAGILIAVPLINIILVVVGTILSGRFQSHTDISITTQSTAVYEEPAEFSYPHGNTYKRRLAQ